MTEEEWLKSTDPGKMLEFFLGKRQYRRKLRLFAIACCRRIWDLLDELGKQAAEIAERNVEGKSTQQDVSIWDDYLENLYVHRNLLTRDDCWRYAAEVTAITLWPGNDVVAARSAMECAQKAIVAATSEYDTLPPKGRRARDRIYRESWTALLRCIFGNPFQPLGRAIDPAWLPWHDGTIRKLAQANYDGRAFDRLPILADALEEAGCTNTDILNHCRQPGEHVRGCWVIDLLLGRS
jgi:hypothetical protein